MAVELLLTLLHGADTVDQVRSLIFREDVAREVATILAEVSEDTAERLFHEAVGLPAHERDLLLASVATLLETAATADERVGRWRKRMVPPGTKVYSLRHHIEQLTWLSFVYLLLARNTLAENRRTTAEGLLPELDRLMTNHVDRAEAVAHAPELSAVTSMAQCREMQRDYRLALTGLTSTCDALKVLSRQPSEVVTDHASQRRERAADTSVRTVTSFLARPAAAFSSGVRRFRLRR